MHLNNIFLKSFRVLLLPFAILYGWIVTLRNWMYTKKYLKSVHFNLPIICVGNLSLGGTGKSPMVEHLLSILSTEYKTATLSRGYKRKTKGYALATEQSTALEIGDEPMQFHLKYPNVGVAVGERRIEAIPQLIQDIPDLQTVILDDAFQHRKIKAGFYILLTSYGDLYSDDFILPTGNLRESRAGAKRANLVIVTKCPATLSADEQREIQDKLNLKCTQELYFLQTRRYSDYEFSVLQLIHEPCLAYIEPVKEQMALGFQCAFGRNTHKHKNVEH